MTRRANFRDGIAAGRALAADPPRDRSICNLCDRPVAEPPGDCPGRRHAIPVPPDPAADPAVDYPIGDENPDPDDGWRPWHGFDPAEDR